MQSLSVPVLTLLHLLGYGAVFLVMGAPLGWQALTFGALLIWISVVDADRFEIPDIGAALLAVTGAVALVGQPRAVWVDALVGGALWPVLFWGVAYGYLRARGFHGLGMGDVKLICGIGLWCGFLATIHVVLAAALAGIILLMVQALLGRGAAQPLGQSMVAFGPFLCLSAWTIWLAGAPT